MSAAAHKYEDEHRGFGTKAIHAGQEPDAHTGAVAVPISLASTFAQASLGVVVGKDQPSSFGKGWESARTGNPTRGAFERAIAACENGRHAAAFSSGMAAITAVVHLLKSGDHVLLIDGVYGGTQRFFQHTVKPTYGIDFDYIDMSEPATIAKHIRPNTKLLWLETPTNPKLQVTDIAAVVRVAKQSGVLVAADNTFMSPYFQNPLTLGADVVVHSVTKYISGHSDVIMGVVVTNNDELFALIRSIQNGMGAVPSLFDAYLALRGLKTLHVRMAAHATNAQAVAHFLDAHPGVEQVCYPGLKSHPNHEIAQRQASGFGAMVSFLINGGFDAARVFLNALKLFTLAESLGAVESLAKFPAVMPYPTDPKAVRNEFDVPDNLIRLSVGIEGLPDLIADLAQALAAAETRP